MPKKLYAVTLTEEERSFLKGLASHGKASAQKINHARILLHADTSPNGPAWKDKQIEEALSVSVRTVERIRKRFVEQGFEASLDRKVQKRRRQRKIDGDAEAHLIASACSDPPEGRSRWTLKLLADKLVELEQVDSVSLETVRQTLKKTNLSLG